MMFAKVKNVRNGYRVGFIYDRGNKVDRPFIRAGFERALGVIVAYLSELPKVSCISYVANKLDVTSRGASSKSQ